MRTTALLVTSVIACTGARDPEAAQDIATIRVFEEGIGASGRIAVFQDRDGAVRSAIPTAHDGSATSPIHAGDQVTLANVGAPKFDLTTYVELRPGDLAVVGETDTEDDEAASAGIVQVSLPTAPPAAVGFQVGAGRSLTPHAGVPLGVQLVDSGAGRFVVVGVATDAAGTPVAFSLLDTPAGVPGAATTLPAWRTDWDRVDVRFSNFAASAVVQTRLDVIAGEARYPALASRDAATTMLIPAGLGTAMDVEVSVAEGETRREWRRIGAKTRELVVDASELLPAIAAVELTPGARPTVAWSVEASAAKADAVVVQLTWGEGDAHRWTVVAPATLRRFQFPALPEELAIWRPDGELRVGVMLVESTAFAGYRELMRHGLDELDAADDRMTLRTSASGHIALP